MGRTRRLFFGACALFVMASPCRAQVALFPTRGLAFGTLTPGVPAKVPPTDAARRAELEIVGYGDVNVVVAVPPALLTPSGGHLPLSFAAGDGIIRWRKSNKETAFTPGQTVTVKIPKGQDGAYIWVGGTAHPAVGQAPGDYAGTITVQIIAAGT